MTLNKLEFGYVGETALKPSVEGLAPISEIHEKRASYDILADLLRILSTDSEINPTRLAQRSNMDTKMTSRYLLLMLNNNLVNKDYRSSDNRYVVQITRKGRGFLTQYQRIVTMLE